MLGNELDAGINLRSIDQIFAHIEGASSENRHFLIRVAYIEIYNEVVNDLLAEV
jgi:hypothetical protein